MLISGFIDGNYKKPKKKWVHMTRTLKQKFGIEVVKSYLKKNRNTIQREYAKVASGWKDPTATEIVTLRVTHTHTHKHTYTQFMYLS